MSAIHIRAPLVALVLALLCTAEASAQAAATGPFAKVPAFPTACYAGNDPFVAKIEAAAESAGRKLGILDRHLEGRNWIVGDSLSFADILVGSMMYRYHNLEIERPRLGSVMAWYQRLTSRPAYQQHGRNGTP